MSLSAGHRSFRALRGWAWVCICVLLGVCQLSAEGELSPEESLSGIHKKILIFHSHDIAYSRFFGISQGFMLEMGNGDYECEFDQFELKIDAADTQEILEERFSPYFPALEAGDYDAVVVIGSPGYELVVNLLDHFNQRTVIFFVGIFDFEQEVQYAHPLVMGNKYSLDLDAVSELAQELFPNRKEIIFLSANDFQAAIVDKKLEKALEAFPDMQLHVVKSENMSNLGLAEFVRKKEKDAVVILYNWSRGRSGLVGYLSGISSVLSLLLEKTKAPVLIMRDYYQQKGVVGGAYIKMNETGIDAAKQIKNYFKTGKPAGVYNIPARTFVDWNMVKRFSVPVQYIPRDAEFINRPFNFWDRYHAQIALTVGSVFFVLSLLLGYAVWRVRRSQSRIALYAQDLEEALAKAQSAQRAKSSFLSTMSHEIRTPLNAVIGLTQLLQDDNLSRGKRNDYLSAVKISSNFLLSLINDILDLSKLEAGQMNIKPVPSDFEKILEDIHTIFNQKTAEKGLKLFCESSGELPIIWIDNPRLRQIVINLVGNAIKFTSKGKITVRASFEKENDHEGTLYFSVADTGVGISDEFKEKIFHPFEQEEDKTRKTRLFEEGTGLGLSISSRLVAAMGGKLEVESRLNEGSTFTVRLEHLKYSHDRSVLKNTETDNDFLMNIKALSYRILLVDDFQMNLMVLDKMLRKLGFVCLLASSGKEALEMLDKREVDLILTDLRMPQMDGNELAAAIRKHPQGAKVKVFLVTGDVYAEEQVSWDDFDGVLVKPLTMEKFRKLFNLLVEDKRQSDGKYINEMKRD